MTTASVSPWARVVVVGSSRPHAEALGRVIEDRAGFTLAGVALTAPEAARLVDERGAHVVVADPDLAPVEDGSDTPHVVVAAHLPLASVLDELESAVDGWTNGMGRGSQTARIPGDELTRREQSVLVLLGQAKPPKQVAQELGISVHTCRGYVKSILAKLDTHSILEAVLEGQRRGLLPPEAPRPLP